MTLSKQISVAAAAVAMLAIEALTNAPVQADALDEMRSSWSSAQTADDYFRVATDLIAYREGRFAKTPEVDYMIATALCRVPEHRQVGHSHFKWILKNYQLGAGRETIETEMQRCGQPARRTEIAFGLPISQAGTGSSEVRMKLYYWLGRENAAVNTEPIEIVDPKSAAELLGRLYSADQADAAKAAVRERMARSVQVLATGNFVIADTGEHTRVQLEAIGKKLEKFLAFFRVAYKMRAPQHLITVYLTERVETLAELAEQLHGFRLPGPSIGYSFKDDLSILGVVRDGQMGTLAHELFHMMVRDQYGDVPPWLDEGTAALYEVTNIATKYLPDRPADIGDAGAPIVGGEIAIRGKPNWRSCVLRKLWIDRDGPDQVMLPTLRELVAMDWRAFNNLEGNELAAQQAVTHATARYFLLFLQNETDKLFKVFGSFAQRNPFEIRTSPGEDTLMRLQSDLGDLDMLDGQFRSWLEQIVHQRNCS